MNNNPLNYLGIARRSGNIILGTDGVIGSLSRKKLALVIVTEDSSASTKDKLDKKCHFYQVPMIVKYQASELSQAIGVKGIHVIGVTNQGLASGFMKALERGDLYEG